MFASVSRVKFGVPLDEVCKNDIPGSLLVLILKLNKEAPVKKDVFRAPGNQANMKKLIHFLQVSIKQPPYLSYNVNCLIGRSACQY